MGLEFRSIFISDVHLGTPDCRADYLLDFLRSTRCQQLYLVGDIVDIQAMAHRSRWPQAHRDVVSELFAIAARGTRVTYIPGNHDAPLRSLCGQFLGGIGIQLEAVHVGADGRRYRVSHGDEFDPERIGSSWLEWIGEYGHRGLCLLNRTVASLRRMARLPYLPLSIIAKTRLAGAMTYIDAYEQRVAAACAEAGFDSHICGHIHFGNLRRIGDVLYMNDGDWVEHCTALVETRDGTMQLLHWSEKQAALAHSGSDQLIPARTAPLALAPLARHSSPMLGTTPKTASAKLDRVG
ncbi:MAG: UDP-2,3-diacylglucosamine diphosphatase [Lysobacteraceae bacterium]